MGTVVHAVVFFASTILTIGFGLDDIVSDSDDRWNAKDTAFFVSFFTCIISTILLIVGAAILNSKDYSVAEEPYQTHYIVSLNDGTQTHGRFYLTHGYIDEDMYYQYMVKRGDGGYSYGKVKENKATIYLSGSDYRVEWYKKQRNWLWFDEEDTFCKIYVPKGCIKEEYNIDLE